MKCLFGKTLFAALSLTGFQLSAQTGMEKAPNTGAKTLFLDVHQLEPGKVTFEGVAQAHTKDLATQGKYGVNFMKYWVDEKKGLVYCLASAADSNAMRNTHAEAHGLLPDHIYAVTDGQEAAMKGTNHLFLDVHYLGAGKVTAKDVAGAHVKDLAVQDKYGVNLLNYWVNEKEGVVMCLAEAKTADALIKTHKEAHGLLPSQVMKVKQGN